MASTETTLPTMLVARRTQVSFDGSTVPRAALTDGASRDAVTGTPRVEVPNQDMAGNRGTNEVIRLVPAKSSNARNKGLVMYLRRQLTSPQRSYVYFSISVRFCQL